MTSTQDLYFLLKVVRVLRKRNWQKSEESIPFNNWKSVEKVRLLNENGEMIGFFSGLEALNMAQEADLDLICVSPKAIPPVCKIGDIGKFKYRQQKKQKNKPITKQKEMQFTVNIGENDLNVKTKKVIDFLQDKNIVKLVIQLRGRDAYRVDDAMEVMRNVCKKISAYAKRIEGPVVRGKNVIAECR